MIENTPVENDKANEALEKIMKEQAAPKPLEEHVRWLKIFFVEDWSGINYGEIKTEGLYVYIKLGNTENNFSVSTTIQCRDNEERKKLLDFLDHFFQKHGLKIERIDANFLFFSGNFPSDTGAPMKARYIYEK